MHNILIYVYCLSLNMLICVCLYNCNTYDTKNSLIMYNLYVFGGRSAT